MKAAWPLVPWGTFTRQYHETVTFRAEVAEARAILRGVRALQAQPSSSNSQKRVCVNMSATFLAWTREEFLSEYGSTPEAVGVEETRLHSEEGCLQSFYLTRQPGPRTLTASCSTSLEVQNGLLGGQKLRGRQDEDAFGVVLASDVESRNYNFKTTKLQQAPPNVTHVILQGRSVVSGPVQGYCESFCFPCNNCNVLACGIFLLWPMALLVMANGSSCCGQWLFLLWTRKCVTLQTHTKRSCQRCKQSGLWISRTRQLER